MKNEKLALAIPTYNKSEILEENLRYMLDEIRLYEIPIYISDDSDNEKTKQMIESLKQEYPHIYYSKNEPGLGHDQNCLATLSLPGEAYIWYLGDSFYVKKGAFSTILQRIEQEGCDFISVNQEGRKLDIPSKTYTDAKNVFEDLSWYITLTGATVYKRDTLSAIERLDTVWYKNFPQLAIILLNVLNGSTLCWINEKLIAGNEKKKTSYWKKHIFEVFAYDWSQLIMSLPTPFTQKEKIKIIKLHDKNTKMFIYKRLLKYRSEGFLDLNTFLKYFKAIKNSLNINMITVFMIAATPRLIIQYYLAIKESWRKTKKRVLSALGFK